VAALHILLQRLEVFVFPAADRDEALGLALDRPHLYMRGLVSVMTCFSSDRDGKPVQILTLSAAPAPPAAALSPARTALLVLVQQYKC